MAEISPSSTVNDGNKFPWETKISVVNTSFGGQWTQDKLEILRRYLDAYTTALKATPFRLIYVDAFAGEGSWSPAAGYDTEDYGEFRGFHEGSPNIALEIQDKPFDRLVFVEKDPTRSYSLLKMAGSYPNRDIEVINDDANRALLRICNNLCANDRAVVFLDPFATQVSWDSVDAIAQTKKVDCWILFPLMAIARMMPNNYEPDGQSAIRLDRVFGGRAHWQGVYHPSAQLPLFGEPGRERESGSERIAQLYRDRLVDAFETVATTPRVLKNSKNSPMFELFFAASNPTGASIAVRIAEHILSQW